MQTTTINHYGHNVDVTEQPFYCTDCDVNIDRGVTVSNILDEELHEAQQEWELSKVPTSMLFDELERRGYVNGVLINPSLDDDNE